MKLPKFSAIACALWLCSGLGFAHELQPALLDLIKNEEGHWQASFKQSSSAPHLKIKTNCSATDEPTLKRQQQNFKLDCAGQTLNFIQVQGLTSTLVDVVVSITEEGEATTHLISSSTGTLQLSQKAEAGLSTPVYFQFGVQHLLFGLDHGLFVLLLLFLIQGGWRLVGLFTSFTLAHSITLGLATLGQVNLPQGPIEALIALSILFLAREVIVVNQNSLLRQYPWLLSFAFGLLHGFGFASALGKVGLPEDAVFYALLLFNIGIEAGQLLILAAALLLTSVINALYLLLAAGAFGRRLSTFFGRRRSTFFSRRLSTFFSRGRFWPRALYLSWPRAPSSKVWVQQALPKYMATLAGGFSLLWFLQRATPILLP